MNCKMLKHRKNSHSVCSLHTNINCLQTDSLNGTLDNRPRLKLGVSPIVMLVF